MNADMMPDVLPSVSCKPVAVVRFPYRGEFVGSYARISILARQKRVRA